MVSFWPFGRADSSTASFEKTLSNLSKKIADLQAKLDRTRTSSRRIKVLWTLYLSFAYVVYGVILLAVVGWKNLGAYEWTGMAGGPVFIYVIRTVLATYYSFRIDSLSARLKAQQAERAKTIQKLKDATKYDSTLQLLEKYGGDDSKQKKSKKKADATESDGKPNQGGVQGGHKPGQGTPGRTGMPPPATANIQRPGTLPPSAPATPRGGQPPFKPPPSLDPGEEFAPNAFGGLPAPPFTQYEPPPPTVPHWYDRILDLILGEDEMAPKNRIALICRQCRLVNGQAPPGIDSLAQVGIWKCMACGATNGEEADEGKKVVREILEAKRKAGADVATTQSDRLPAEEDADVDKDTSTVE